MKEPVADRYTTRVPPPQPHLFDPVFDKIGEAIAARLQPTLNHIATGIQKIMATLADIQTAVQSVVDSQTQLVSSVTALDTAVEQQAIPLLNQLAAGQSVDPAQAQAVVDALTSAKSGLDSAKTAADQTTSDLAAAVTADTPPTP